MKSFAKLLLLVLLATSGAWAKDKPAAYEYQDGVLVGFHENYGSINCSGGNCHSGWRVYTIRVGEHSLGISHRGFKDSILADKLPGLPVKVRTANGSVYVKVGDRESKFSLVEAE